MTIKRLFKSRLFLTGFLLLTSLFLISIFYYIFFKDYIPLASLIYANDGKPLQAPYSASIYPPLGTDEFGRNIAIVMIVGAKYTIGAAIIISLIRVVPAVFIGLILQFFMKSLKKPLKSIAESINYFPTTLLAFLLLNWISLEGVLEQETLPSMGIQILMYVCVLSFIFVPLNSILISNEIEIIYNKEFIKPSITLGADSWHIIRKHIRPFLVPQISLIFIREFIQTLILMAHLGILGIFIGGTVFMENLFGRSTPASPSSEWAGVLGIWWDYLWTSYPWIAFIPITFLTLLILAAKAILEALEKTLNTEAYEIHMPSQDNIKRSNLDMLKPFDLISSKENN